MATLVKIPNAGTISMVNAAPTATPRKGAMQGVATTVARTPEKKILRSLIFWKVQQPTPVRESPISKTPLKLMAKTRRNAANTKTKTGS